jgi:nitrate reductase gamma subunit
MSMLLSFGRTTFGSLVRIIPGSTDIFMRRFMMGIQLAALLLAGIGAVALINGIVGLVRRHWQRGLTLASSNKWARRSIVLSLTVLVVLAVAPAWTQIATRDDLNATAINAQEVADTEQGSQIAPLLEYIRQADNGRAYAGLPNNWGANFRVGAVPVFKYVESQDIDEVGYTLRTASLMTDPEYFFDQSNPGDYLLFGVRYIIEPVGRSPLVPARLIMRRSPYALWELSAVGYFHVAQVVGSITANRGNVGVRSIHYLRSDLPDQGKTLVVNYAGNKAADASDKVINDRNEPMGAVTSERAHLGQGAAEAVVRMRTPGMVVLSASFDPGWQVTVDGHSAATVMVAPALVAVSVGRGVHRVVFTYVGFNGYTPLFTISALVLAGAFLIDYRRKTPRESDL